MDGRRAHRVDDAAGRPTSMWMWMRIPSRSPDKYCSQSNRDSFPKRRRSTTFGLGHADLLRVTRGCRRSVIKLINAEAEEWVWAGTDACPRDEADGRAGGCRMQGEAG